MSGIAEAYMDQVPLVVLACGIRQDTGAAFQLHDIDQIAVLRPVTKGAFRIATADAARGIRSKVTFMTGLMEGSVPGRARQDPFIKDAEREAIREAVQCDLQLIANLHKFGWMFYLLGPGQVRYVYQTVNSFFKLNEQAKVGQVTYNTFMFCSNSVLGKYILFGPWIL